MNVHELIAWLEAFEDKGAVVKVLHNEAVGGYCAQGGVTSEVVFDPEKHAEHTDLRNNQFASQDQKENRTLLLGLDEN